ncbi:MAG: hypothetical protein JO281_12255 [Pseudonocardiales bacterium]|nr:hypothetical protein [Pseudonocardiales bacterium]
MAAARFQVVSVARATHVSVPAEPDTGAGSVAELAPPRGRVFTWRFMSANNRSLARSARTSPDVESCLATIRILQEGLPRAVSETSRNGHGQWVWRVRLADEVVAIAARSYPREIRARMTCKAFLQLVAETADSAPVQVMYR